MSARRASTRACGEAWLSRDSTKDAVSMSHRSVAIFAVGEWRWRGDLDAIHHRAWSSPRSRVQRDGSARRRSPAGGRQSQRGCLQKCVKRKVTDRENSFARPRAHVVRATCFLGIPGSKQTRRGRSMQGLCLAGQVALVARARGVPDAALRGRLDRRYSRKTISTSALRWLASASRALYQSTRHVPMATITSTRGDSLALMLRTAR